MSVQLPLCILSYRLALSGGRSSRGSGMRRVSSREWPFNVVTLLSSRGFRRSGDHLLQCGAVHRDLDLVHFVPWEAEALELTLERRPGSPPRRR